MPVRETFLPVTAAQERHAEAVLDRSHASRALADIVSDAFDAGLHDQIVKFALQHRPVNHTSRLLVPIELDTATKSQVFSLADTLSVKHVHRPVERTLLSTVVNYLVVVYNYDEEFVLRRGFLAPEAVNKIVDLRQELIPVIRRVEDQKIVTSRISSMERDWERYPLSVGELNPKSELAVAFDRIHSRERLKPISNDRLEERWSSIKTKITQLNR